MAVCSVVPQKQARSLCPPGEVIQGGWEVDYNDSGAVASSSQVFVASSTWLRTAWRTRS